MMPPEEGAPGERSRRAARYVTAFEGLDRAEIARRYGRAAAFQEDATEATAFWLRCGALLLIGALLVLLAAYTLAQVTSRDSARRILGRAIPEITDFDRTLAAHYDELMAAASAPAGAGGITLSAYPLRAVLQPREILNHSPAQVRQTLLTRSSDLVYDKGSAAFSAYGRPVKLGDFSLLSAPWVFGQALNLLNPGFHSRAQDLARGSLVVTVILGLLLLPLSRGYNQVVMYGMALLIAALPVVLFSGIAWLVAQLVFGTSVDPLIAGTSDLTRDVTWYVVLSYLIYAALALALVILGLLFERLTDLLAPPPDPVLRRA